MNKITLGLIQSSSNHSAETNLDNTIKKINQAARLGARIVCTQELFRTPYFCKTESSHNFALAEPIPGPTTEIMGRLAKQLKVVIISSIFEKRTKGLYHNTACIHGTNGKLILKYRKMHIPDDPLYYEKFYFTPGDLGFKTVQTEFGKLGVLICWDQWYPEAARLLALQGAEIIFYPTAIGWLKKEGKKQGLEQHQAWRTVQQSHAIANGVFVAAVNRVGFESIGKSGIQFFGRSFVCNPLGQIIKEASGNREEVLLVRCNLGEIEKTRHTWPFLRDRRIDAYHDLTRRYLD